jgi:hypothetical protein
LLNVLGVVIAAIATIAAIFAVVYTKRAAEAAAQAAKAAADQVELQRPRPIVVASFAYSFSENKGNMAADDKEFHLENIGNSPAFDLELSVLETPGTLAELGEASQLETEKLPYLVPGIPPAICSHTLKPHRGVLSLRHAAGFVHDAVEFFKQQSKADASSRSPDSRYEIRFSIAYSSLDARRFTQPYRLVIYFVLSKAWIEPIGSLLEAKATG